MRVWEVILYCHGGMGQVMTQQSSTEEGCMDTVKDMLPNQPKAGDYLYPPTEDCDSSNAVSTRSGAIWLLEP